MLQGELPRWNLAWDLSDFTLRGLLVVACPQALAVSCVTKMPFLTFTLRSEWSHFPPTDALGARICPPFPSSLSTHLMVLGYPRHRVKRWC